MIAEARAELADVGARAADVGLGGRGDPARRRLDDDGALGGRIAASRAEQRQPREARYLHFTMLSQFPIDESSFG